MRDSLLRRLVIALPLATTMLSCTAEPSATPRTVFVHLFEWTWPDVARECETTLGPAGIAAVQISPPNEHIDQRLLTAPNTNAWWARYQPVSYRLVSRSGDEAAFSDMLRRCRNAGVEIYADVVANHMADQVGVGIAGSTFNRGALHYPDYGPEDFTDNCRIAGSDYEWHDDAAVRAERRQHMRACNLYALPDLATSEEHVQATVARYLQSLYDHGVRGFRMDGAKHMFPEDIVAILARVNGDFFTFQEVIDPGGQPFSATRYLGGGSITEFRYSLRVGGAFASGNIASLRKVGDDLLPSERAVVFIDNHDNQRGHGMAAPLSHRSGRRYELANVFMLAFPYGYPKLMSSYAWGDNDSAGPPHDGAGNTSPVYTEAGEARCGGDGWLCEHRRPAMLNMVRFRNAMAAAGAGEVTNWRDNGGGRIAFSRAGPQGTSGFVAINVDSGTWDTELSTGLPAGRYCNIASGSFYAHSGTCAKKTIEIQDEGFIHLKLDADDAVVILRAPPEPRTR